MQYRRVGSSGLKVSAISLGGWITFGGTLDEAATRRILVSAVERGINFIDLADVYARGAAERTVGRILPELDRSKLVLSSKCFWPMSDDPNDRGLSRKHILESVERSLRNLGTDYLDLYFCHREDPETPLEETARAMDDLIRQGKILYWGTSVWSAASLRAVVGLCHERGYSPPIVEQPQYSLLERGIEAEIQPAALDLGMGLVIWSPLAGGMLTGKYDHGVPPGSRGATSRWLEDYLTPGVLEQVRAFTRLAQEQGLAPSQLALAWALDRPGVACAITGATAPEQLEQNLAALEVKVTEPASRALEAIFPARR
jgi:voltage-dependent potassium channel beta subunit